MRRGGWGNTSLARLATTSAVFLFAAGVTGCAGPVHEIALPEPAPLTSIMVDAGIALAPTSDSPTETRRSIGLRESLDIALEANVDLALARAEAQLAKARGLTANATWLPDLEVGGIVRNVDGRVQGSFGNLRDVDYDSFRSGFSFVYALNIGEQIHKSIRTHRDVGASVLKSLSAEQRLILRVTELYQNLLLAEVGFEIASELVADNEEFVAIASARAQSGLGLGTEVARARAELAAKRRQLEDVRRIRHASSILLSGVLRLDPQVMLTPEERELLPLPIIPPASAWNPRDHALTRPDVEAAADEYGAASQGLYASWWDLLAPDIGVRWSRLEIGEDSSDLAPQTDKAAFLVWTLSPEQIGWIRQRGAEKQMARLRYDRARDRAKVEVEQAWQDIRAARSQIPFAYDGLEAAESNLTISRSRYRAGTALVIEVLDAQNTLAEARLSLARSITAFNIGQARLLAASGTLTKATLLQGTFTK